MIAIHPRLGFPAAAALLAVAVPMLLLGGGDPPPRAALARVAARPVAVTPIPAAALSFAMTAPPFDVDRTPGAPAPAAPPPPPPPPPPPVPKLVGVAGGRGKAVALVKGVNGETVMLSRGQSVDGWRLVGIGPTSAVFALGGNRQTVRLDFGNKAAGPAASPIFNQPVTPSASPSPQIPPPPARDPRGPTP
jgi:hypothetical protein